MLSNFGGIVIELILNHFGIDETTYIGAGAEAKVFDLGNGTVLRICREGAKPEDVSARTDLITQIAAHADAVDFQVPLIRDVGFEHEFHFTIEDRLTGEPMSDALVRCTGQARCDLNESYLEASTQIGRLWSGDELYGELALNAPLQSPSFEEFLSKRAEASLAVCGLEIDVSAIVDQIEPPERPALVHLDYCPSNVMCEDGKISAVFDFGGTTIAGSADFNPIVAAAFLSPMITPSATAQDHEQALDWLQSQGLSEVNAPVQEWLAAYWSFCGANEDLALYKWCRSVLIR